MILINFIHEAILIQDNQQLSILQTHHCSTQKHNAK